MLQYKTKDKSSETILSQREIYTYLERVELVDLAHIEVISLKVELVWHCRSQVVELREVACHF